MKLDHPESPRRVVLAYGNANFPSGGVEGQTSCAYDSRIPGDTLFKECRVDTECRTIWAASRQLPTELVTELSNVFMML